MDPVSGVERVKMTSEQEHLLLLLMEECLEIGECCSRIGIRASKILRFGEGEVQPGESLPNLQRLCNELTDLLAVIETLEGSGMVLRDGVGKKSLKIDAFMEYSRRCGRLEEKEGRS